MSARTITSVCAGGSHSQCRVDTCDCDCHIVEVCAVEYCVRAAATDGLCAFHRNHHYQLPDGCVAVDLTDEELAAIRAQVELDAAPLFVAAMRYITGRHIAALPAAARAAIVQPELTEARPTETVHGGPYV